MRATTIVPVILLIIVWAALWIAFRKTETPSLVPCLLLLLSGVPGDVLELGASLYTTNLLDHLSTYQRNIITIDTDVALLSRLRAIPGGSPSHSYRCPTPVKRNVVLNNVMYAAHPSKQDASWNRVTTKHFYGVVIIQQVPTQRRWKDVVRFRERAYAIVVPFSPHDAIRNKVRYTKNMAKALSTFKHAVFLDTLPQPVAVVSCFIDVARVLAPLSPGGQPVS